MKTRVADFSDAKDLFDWRNNSETRQMFISSAEISWEEHLSWLESALVDQRKFLFISEVDGLGKIGSCRFDWVIPNKTAFVSLVVNPEFRGGGFGVRVLQSSINAIPESESLTIKAKIKEINFKSVNTFLKAGFQPQGVADDGILLFELTLGK